jgi:hypothetical protein
MGIRFGNRITCGVEKRDYDAMIATSIKNPLALSERERIERSSYCVHLINNDFTSSHGYQMCIRHRWNRWIT